MTAFLIGDEDVTRLKAAVSLARTKPIPWDVLRQNLPDNQETDRVTLADRKGRTPAREPVEVMLPFGWRVAITCEEQPAGILLHISMSSPVKGRVPLPEAMVMVVQACGFTKDAIERSWLEEFEPGWFAPNVLIVLSERKTANA